MDNNQEYYYYSMQDNQLYSKNSQNPQLVDLQGCQIILAQTIPNLTISFKHDLNEVEKLQLRQMPNSQGGLQDGLELIDQAKQRLIQFIDQHFASITQNYQELYRQVPSQESRMLLEDTIEQNVKELEQLEKKIRNQNLTLFDVKNFFDKNYSKKETDISHQIKKLADATHNVDNLTHLQFNQIYLLRSDIPQRNFPVIHVDNKVLEKICHQLVEYISTSLPSEDPLIFEAFKNNQLHIQQKDYFYDPNQQILPIVNEMSNNINLYNVNINKYLNLNLNMHPIEIPYQHSTIIAQNSDIFICGGIYSNNGAITAHTFKFNAEQISFEQVKSMNVKRVGHSLVFSEQKSGVIYAIGGLTDDKVKTKLCEKYKMGSNTWENIAMMHYARSRSASLMFNNKFIYTFFGTDSYGKDCKEIERYDIYRNIWEVIEPINQVSGMESTCSSAVQINDAQILLFGGFSDSVMFDNNINFKRQMLIFNTNNNSFTVFGGFKLPIDYISSSISQPIIAGDNIYAFGHFLQEESPSQKRCLDTEYILKIDKNSCVVEKVILTDSQK